MSYHLLRIDAVLDATGLNRRTLYRYVKAGKFPRPVAIGERARAWREDDIRAWCEGRDEASERQPAR